MIVPTFTCPHCENEVKPTIDTTGEIPVGVLQLCDCPGARAAWEQQHRAAMEARKNALRGTAIRSRSIIHAGRTSQPTGKQRYRSR